MARSGALLAALLLALVCAPPPGALGLAAPSAANTATGWFTRVCVAPCPETGGVVPTMAAEIAPCVVPVQFGGIVLAGGAAVVADVSPGRDYIFFVSPGVGGHVDHPAARFAGQLCLEQRDGYAVLWLLGVLSW